MSDSDLSKAFPWALRVLRFSDHGLPPGDALEGGYGPWEPPRSAWGPGPWQEEPDFVEWRADGSPYPLLILRGTFGALCGYVGVPPAHTLHGRLLPLDDFSWSSPSGELLQATGEPPEHWWLGFDCGHHHHLSPGREAAFRLLREMAGKSLVASTDNTGFAPERRYVDLEACRRRTEALAHELTRLS